MSDQQESILSTNRPTITAIHEHKQAENETQQEVSCLPRIDGTIMDVVMVINSDGVTRSQSPSMLSLTGYSPAEQQGRSIFDLIHPDDKPDAAREFARLLEKDHATAHMEFRIRHKDGSWHLVDAIGKNLLSDPVITGIVANICEITEHKKPGEAPALTEEHLRPLIQTFSWM